MSYRHGMQPHRSRTGVSYINDEQYIRTYVKTTDGSIHFILPFQMSYAMCTMVIQGIGQKISYSMNGHPSGLDISKRAEVCLGVVPMVSLM